MTPPRLLTLGQLRLDGSAADALLNGRRKELVLLVYLARRAPRPVPRTELTALLWGEREEARARHSLRQALHRLRQAIDSGLEIGPAEVRLAEGAVELDAAAFEQEVAAGRLREAAGLWAGDFLPATEESGGEAYRSWLEAEREGLRRRFAWTLEQLTQQAEQRGAWTEAAEWAERWAELLPYDETAHLRLIEALRLAGRASEGAARHAAFAARLRQDLEEEPSAAFARLGETLRVTAARAAPRRPGAAALFTPDLAGRAAAFAELVAAWTAVEAGEAAVVLVEGEEGIGRTRLCQEFLRWLRGREPSVLLLQATAYDTDAETSHAALRRLLAELPGAPGLAGAADAALAELSAELPSLRKRFPRLPQPEASEAALGSALHEVLRDVAAEVPVLLLLDDLPVADTATQRLVLSLARECPASVLLLLTGRSELLDASAAGVKLRQLSRLRSLRLRPLSEPEVQAVLDSMLALAPGTRAPLAARLHAESGGNPLFTVELVTALVEDGMLSLDAQGAWRLEEELAARSLPVPMRVRESTRERLAQLEGPVRAVLEAAAVLGPHIEPEVLEAVAGLPPAEFGSALDALISRRLLREAAAPPLAYEFTHEIVRRIAHEQVGPTRRRALHRAATVARFPALHLPRQLTSFIGREPEISAASRLLASSRLLTLTGPAGTGKTRLSLQVAAEQAEWFPDGVFFVSLAPVTDPARVVPAIAQVLGVKEQPGRSFAESLQAHLHGKLLLLVLDNFEQIVEAAPAVVQLLARTPGLKLLITSRIPLHVQGEQEYPVPPLALPDLRRHLPLEQLVEYEAVRLFSERAQAARPAFSVTKENAPAVVEICHRLDGLPLAIELAAARTRILPPQAILSRLQSRLKLLTGGARDLPQRQQTLRDAIAWSYDLLSDAEKRLFRRVSVFSGGRTLEAIEAVCSPAADPRAGSGAGSASSPQLGLDGLETVSSLVDKSLLRQEENAVGEARFVMLETIHEFAAEQLTASGEADRVRRRHAEYFLALAEAAKPQPDGHGQGRWLARLEEEHDNLRTALRYSLGQRDLELAGRLTATLWWFWHRHGHFREGRHWLEEVLSADALSPGSLSPDTRAKALYGAGVLAWQQHDFAAALPHYEESLALSRELQDAPGIARNLNALGVLAAEQGDLVRAEAVYEEAVLRFREIGHSRGVGAALNNLANIAHNRRDHARAESLYQESLALARQRQDLAEAGGTLRNLGHLAYRRGDLHLAAERLRESIRLMRGGGDVYNATYGLAVLAVVTAATGDGERAARLFGAAEAHFAAMGSHVNPQDREEHDRAIAAARARLDEQSWQAAWAAGQAMTLEEALACALGEEGGEERVQAGSSAVL